MVESLRFLHLISVMVYFGLPFTFGRWWRTAANDPGSPAFGLCLMRIRNFSLVHLNLAGGMGGLTGLGLAFTVYPNRMPVWIPLAFVLWLASLVNLNAILLPRLKAVMSNDPADPKGVTALTRGMAVFSGLHHTLVTALVALMVFKPVW